MMLVRLDGVVYYGYCLLMIGFCFCWVVVLSSKCTKIIEMNPVFFQNRIACFSKIVSIVKCFYCVCVMYGMCLSEEAAKALKGKEIPFI